MQGHMIKSAVVYSIVECGLMCLQDSNCKSFNTCSRKSELLCELNNATYDEYGEDVLSKFNCSYHSALKWSIFLAFISSIQHADIKIVIVFCYHSSKGFLWTKAKVCLPINITLNLISHTAASVYTKLFRAFSHWKTSCSFIIASPPVNWKLMKI